MQFYVRNYVAAIAFIIVPKLPILFPEFAVTRLK